MMRPLRNATDAETSVVVSKDRGRIRDGRSFALKSTRIGKIAKRDAKYSSNGIRGTMYSDYESNDRTKKHVLLFLFSFGSNIIALLLGMVRKDRNFYRDRKSYACNKLE